MRPLIILIFIFLISNAFGQNKICTLSEIYSSYSTGSSDLIVFTDTNGMSFEYNIPHFISDLSSHDKAFNQILNGLLSENFELLSPSPIILSDFIGIKPLTVRTWFLRKTE